MVTVGREQLDSGHFVWTHRPMPPDVEQIIAAERSYRREPEPPKPAITGKRTAAHDRADRQFAMVYPSKRRLVVQRVARKVPKTFVDDVVNNTFRRFFMNLVRVNVPDDLVTASLFRQVKWTCTTFLKSLEYWEYVNYVRPTPRNSSAARTPEDEVITASEVYGDYHASEHTPASDTPLIDAHHDELMAAVERLPPARRDAVKACIDDRRGLTPREWQLVRHARKQLAELMPTLAA